jgi:TonB family protein
MNLRQSGMTVGGFLMRRTLLAFGSLIVMFTTAPAQAEPTVFTPNSDWQLRSYDDKCRMIRTFGAGEDELTLWVDKGGPGPGVNLTLIGDAVRNPRSPALRVGFRPGELDERSFTTGTSSKGRPVLGLAGVQPYAHAGDEAQREAADQRYAAINALELAGAVFVPIKLELDGFQPMMLELLSCTDALTERLTRNSAAASGNSRPTKAKDEASWAQKIQANYPVHLLREGEQGTVGVRLTINKEGRPTFCEVTMYSGPASFNDTACLQLIRHAQFSPATDETGSPVASFYSLRVTYKIGL